MLDFSNISDVIFKVKNNEIINQVFVDKRNKTWNIELNEPWTWIGLSKTVKLDLISLCNITNDAEEMIKVSNYRGLNESRNLDTRDMLRNIFNEKIAWYRDQVLQLLQKFSGRSLWLHTLLISYVFQHPLNSINERDLVNYDNSTDISSIIELCKISNNQPWIILSTGIKMLVIDFVTELAQYNTNLLLIEILWPVDEDVVTKSVTLGRHLFDHYGYPHYHVFENYQQLFAYSLYNVYRTWKDLVYGYSMTRTIRLRRINYGIQLLNSNFTIDQRLVKLSAMLVYASLVGTVEGKFSRYGVLIEQAIDGFNYSDVMFSRILMSRIPVTRYQLDLMDEYNLRPIEMRYWEPEHIDRVQIPTSRLLSSQMITEIPVGNVVDPGVLVKWKRDQIVFNVPSNEFLLDLFISNAVPNIYEFIHEEIDDESLRVEYNQTKILTLNSVIDNVTKLDSLIVPVNYRNNVLVGVQNPAYSDSIEGLIYKSFTNNSVPEGVIRLIDENTKVVADYIDVNDWQDGPIVWTGQQFILTLELCHLLTTLMLPDIGRDATVINGVDLNVLYINYSHRVANLNKVMPYLNTFYKRTRNDMLGDKSDFELIINNLNAKIVYWRFFSTEMSNNLIVTRMVSALTLNNGALFNFSFEYFEVGSMVEILRDVLLAIETNLYYAFFKPTCVWGMTPCFSIMLSMNNDLPPSFMTSAEDLMEDEILTSSVMGFIGSALTLVHSRAEYLWDDLYANPGALINVQVDTQFAVLGMSFGFSKCDRLLVEKLQTGNMGQLVARGIVSNKALEINRRRGFISSFEYNLDDNLFGVNQLSEYRVNTISFFQLITQSMKQAIVRYLLEPNLIVKPHISFGSSQLNDIYYTMGPYYAVDRQALRTYGLTDVFVKQFTFVPIDNQPIDPEITQFFDTFPMDGVCTIIESLTYNIDFSVEYFNSTILGYLSYLFNNRGLHSAYMNVPYYEDSMFDYCSKWFRITWSHDDDDPENPSVRPGPTDKVYYHFSSHEKIRALRFEDIEPLNALIVALGCEMTLTVASKIDYLDAITILGRTAMPMGLSRFEWITIINLIMKITKA